jgi:flagellar hook-associated protein 2
MSTSSTLNSVLSALGGTTGIDVTSAVDTILYADRAPERGWQAQQATLASQASAINQIENETSALNDSLNNLSDLDGALSSVTATSSDTSLLSATAVSGTAASNHTITINSLATAASWYSDAETSSSTALPSGTIAITVGSGTPVSITIGSGVNTLDELAASINSQSLGLTANVITDANGARLALTSSTTGSASDFTVSNTNSIGFTRSGTATNASLTVDGVPISSASNTVTGAISGVTLNLLGAAPATTNSSGAVTTAATTINLSLGPDTDSINTAVSDFVTAYNTLISDVNTQTGYDSSTQTAGVLQSDSAITGLQSALLASTNYGSGSGVFQTLDSLGVTTNTDGTLTLNSTTLASAVQTNSAAVATFFQGAALNGFANSVTSSLNIYTDPTQGAFTVDLQSISNENTDLTNETSTLELYLSSQQTILTAQYNAADIAIQQLPEQIKQIQALLNPNSNSSS